MNTELTVQQRAANLLQARLSWPQAEGCARDLAVAGLLADPSTPPITDELAEVIKDISLWADVIEAASRWAEADYHARTHPFGTTQNVWRKEAERRVPAILDAARQLYPAVDIKANPPRRIRDLLSEEEQKQLTADLENMARTRRRGEAAAANWVLP